MRVMLVSLFFVEYAIELANALSKKNCVHLILLESRVGKTIGKNINEKIRSRVSYTLLRYRSIKHPSIFKTIFAIFNALISFRPEVIHIQSCRNPLFLIFLLLGFIPVIFTLHDVISHPGSDEESAKAWRVRLRDKKRKYAYSKIIVHGEYLKKQFIENYKRPARDIIVIPHGCLFSFLPRQQQNLFDEEPHSILFFGRMEKYKGLKILIDAVPLISKKIQDIKVIVAGEGNDLEAHLPLLLSSRHFEVHRRFIPHDEIPYFFQRTAVVVTPYIEASQSGIIAMAYAFGKPVISSRVGSLAEVVKNGDTGLLVPPGNVKSLADAIIFLLKDHEKRKEMGKAALHLAKTTLSWEHVASMTEEVYRNVVNSK